MQPTEDDGIFGNNIKTSVAVDNKELRHHSLLRIVVLERERATVTICQPDKCFMHEYFSQILYPITDHATWT